MNNLLKAESYKLLHNKSFWGLFLFLLYWEVLCCLTVID